MDFGLGMNTFYPMYPSTPVTPVSGSPRVTRGSEGTDLLNKVQKTECQTCKNRKYVDGSNEPDVSFKTPGHIDPSQSAARVLGHEREHVANAVAEGNKPGKQLMSASVSLQMSICPECGRAYVSGGLTKTTIKSTSDNPYEKAANKMIGSLLAGSNFDSAV